MYLCNINISCTKLQDILKVHESLLHVITVNAEAIVRSQSDCRLKNIINENCATIDGQIPLWLYNIKYKNNKAEKISGSDLIYDICKWSKSKNYKIFLLGGNPEANKISIEKLTKKYDINIDGFSPEYSPYPFNNSLNETITERIRKFNPDIIFVAFGMGKQEYWISDNRILLESIGVKIAIGCGGTFDFVAGRIKRAPKWIQKIGLEGFWRLFKEPQLFRLKRLLISFKIFKYYFKDLFHKTN